MKFYLLAFVIGTVLGCGHRKVLTDNSNALYLYPKKVEIKNVPFIAQAIHQCGPATLAMVMGWAGKKVSVNELADQILIPQLNGSLQQDMITAARRQGMLAVPITGIKALLSELSAGHPVVVFENLGLNWLPQYHYAVVFGYDFEKQEVLMHSGPEQFKHLSLDKFENDWSPAGSWGLVVLPPGYLAATANEDDHIKAAAVLEQFGKMEEAKIIYQSILFKWPSSILAEIGLANTNYALKDYPRAIKHLHRAIIKRPGLAYTWYNLTVAQLATNRKMEAAHSADIAYRLASPEQKKSFAMTLKEMFSTRQER